GEDSEGNRHSGLERNAGNTAGAFAGNIVKMRCLTADHRAERNERLVAMRHCQLARHDGNVEGPGYAHDFDLLLNHTVPFQGIERTAQQRLDHKIVEPRGDEREAQITGQQFSLDYLRLIVGHKSFLALAGRQYTYEPVRPRSIIAVHIAGYFKIKGCQ